MCTLPVILLSQGVRPRWPVPASVRPIAFHHFTLSPPLWAPPLPLRLPLKALLTLPIRGLVNGRRGEVVRFVSPPVGVTQPLFPEYPVVCFSNGLEEVVVEFAFTLESGGYPQCP